MKFVARESEALVFRLTKREHETLRTLLRLRTSFPRAPRSLSHDSAPSTPEGAVLDLEAALLEHRATQATSVDQLLADASRLTTEAGGFRLRISLSEAELLLQALNEVRMGAWEKLGCPESESSAPQSVGEKHFVGYWALHLTALYQGVLLRALGGPDHGPAA